MTVFALGIKWTVLAWSQSRVVIETFDDRPLVYEKSKEDGVWRLVNRHLTIGRLTLGKAWTARFAELTRPCPASASNHDSEKPRHHEEDPENPMPTNHRHVTINGEMWRLSEQRYQYLLRDIAKAKDGEEPHPLSKYRAVPVGPPPVDITNLTRQQAEELLKEAVPAS